MSNYVRLYLEIMKKDSVSINIFGEKYSIYIMLLFTVFMWAYFMPILFGASPDTFTAFLQTVFVLYPPSYSPNILKSEVLINSLPIDKPTRRKWNRLILLTVLASLLPFQYLCYLKETVDNNGSLFAIPTGHQTIENLLVGTITGITLALILQAISEFNLLHKISSGMIRRFIYIAIGLLFFGCMHYLNLWLIGLW